jgi:hypothetical protein
VGHALAEERPLGQAIRAVSVDRQAVQAAAAADAGDLEHALRLTGMEPGLATLGAAWPAAVRPAQRRLARMPAKLVFQAPVLQLLGYCTLVGGFQLVIYQLLRTKVLPSMQEALAETTATEPAELAVLATIWATAAIALGLPLVAIGVAGVLGSPMLPGWGRHLARAREAALVDGLLDAGAPQQYANEFMSSCTHLRGEGYTKADLASIFDLGLADAQRVHARFVAGLRLFAYGALIVLPAGLTLTIYQAISSLGLGG